MIYEKLQRARVLLQERRLKKSGFNKFENFQYFELQDFLPAVNEILEREKIGAAFKIVSAAAELTLVDLEDKDTAVFSIPFIHRGGETKRHPMQELGASITYARRYLWMIAMEIVEHDALDAMRQDAPPEGEGVRNKVGEWRGRIAGAGSQDELVAIWREFSTGADFEPLRNEVAPIFTARKREIEAREGDGK